MSTRAATRGATRAASRGAVREAYGLQAQGFPSNLSTDFLVYLRQGEGIEDNGSGTVDRWEDYGLNGQRAAWWSGTTAKTVTVTNNNIGPVERFEFLASAPEEYSKTGPVRALVEFGAPNNGIMVGPGTGSLTDEVIWIMDSFRRTGTGGGLVIPAGGENKYEFVWNGSNYDIFLNGEQLPLLEGGVHAQQITLGADLLIGLNSTFSFLGTIREFKVYDSTGLKCYLKGDGPNAASWVDQTGNGNSGNPVATLPLGGAVRTKDGGWREASDFKANLGFVNAKPDYIADGHPFFDGETAPNTQDRLHCDTLGPTNSGDLSIFIRFKIPDAGESNLLSLLGSDSDVDNSWRLSVSGSEKIKFYDGLSYISEFDYVPGQWHTIVITVKDELMQFWQDGQMVRPLQNFAGKIFSLGEATIGAAKESGSGVLKCEISDLIISDKAFSGADILAIEKEYRINPFIRMFVEGDSISNDMWTAMRYAFPEGVDYQNHWAGGERTDQMVAQIDGRRGLNTDWTPLDANDYVLLYAGVNDGSTLTAQETKDNLDILWAKAAELVPKSRIIAMTLHHSRTSTPETRAVVDERNAYIRSQAGIQYGMLFDLDEWCKDYTGVDEYWTTTDDGSLLYRDSIHLVQGEGGSAEDLCDALRAVIEG